MENYYLEIRIGYLSVAIMIRCIVRAKVVGRLAMPRYGIISHKFYFGQGATLRMHLTKRTYAISIETIWEDYSLVEI